MKEGDRVLILAGAGGVGHLAVQIAVAAKAEVYATCDEANLDYLTTLKPHAISINLHQHQKSIRRVDVLIDLVGGDTALDALEIV